METTVLIEGAGKIIDLMGVGVIIFGILLVTVFFVVSLSQRKSFIEAYERYRRGIGRAMLLGLEILVAADIIRTVAITPTLESVAVLGLIVVVRTFLSWSLELELSGRWPWQRSPDSHKNERE